MPCFASHLVVLFESLTKISVRSGSQRLDVTRDMSL